MTSPRVVTVMDWVPLLPAVDADVLAEYEALGAQAREIAWLRREAKSKKDAAYAAGLELETLVRTEWMFDPSQPKDYQTLIDWVNCLPRSADVVLNARLEIAGFLREAGELEQQIAAKSTQLQRASSGLEERIKARWTHEEIERAQQMAEAIDRR